MYCLRTFQSATFFGIRSDDIIHSIELHFCNYLFQDHGDTKTFILANSSKLKELENQKNPDSMPIYKCNVFFTMQGALTFLIFFLPPLLFLFFYLYRDYIGLMTYTEKLNAIRIMFVLFLIFWGSLVCILLSSFYSVELYENFLILKYAPLRRKIVMINKEDKATLYFEKESKWIFGQNILWWREGIYVKIKLKEKVYEFYLPVNEGKELSSLIKERWNGFINLELL